jgi:hypothetical protein
MAGNGCCLHGLVPASTWRVAWPYISADTNLLGVVHWPYLHRRPLDMHILQRTLLVNAIFPIEEIPFESSVSQIVKSFTQTPFV